MPRFGALRQWGCLRTCLLHPLAGGAIARPSPTAATGTGHPPRRSPLILAKSCRWRNRWSAARPPLVLPSIVYRWSIPCTPLV